MTQPPAPAPGRPAVQQAAPAARPVVAVPAPAGPVPRPAAAPAARPAGAQGAPAAGAVTTAAGGRVQLNELLRIATERKSSDLHLKVGAYPVLRLDGRLTPLQERERLSREWMTDTLFGIMTPAQKELFKKNTDLDMAYSVPGLGRFRVNVYQQRGTMGAVLRVIPMKILTIRELGLPPILERLSLEPRGLILVTGTTGSGKSTSLAAMVDHVNSNRNCHIMTIEDPIEYPAPRQAQPGEPARGRLRRGEFRQRAAGLAAPGPRRDPRRRDARFRDHFHGARRRRDRPPRALDAAHRGRRRDHQPRDLGLPAAPAAADTAPAGDRSPGDRLDAPGPPRRRDRPHPGGRGAHRDDPGARVHHRPGAHEGDHGHHRRRHLPVRHADLRPGADGPLPPRAHHLRGGAPPGHEPRRLRPQGARDPVHRGHVAGGVRRQEDPRRFGRPRRPAAASPAPPRSGRDASESSGGFSIDRFDRK